MGDWQCGVSDNSNRLTHLDYEEVVVKKEDPLEHSEELSTNIVCCETTLKSEDFEYVEDETIKMEVYPEDLKVSLGELPTVVHEDSVDDMDDPQHNSTCVPIKKEDLPSSIKVLNEIKPTESEELDIHYENIKTEKIKEPSESELFFSCEVCKKVFVNKNDLLEHKSDKVDCIALDVDENEWKEDVKLTQDFGIQLPHTTQNDEANFEEVVTEKNPTGPSTKNNKRTPRKVPAEKLFQCHLCSKLFSRKCILLTHVLIHSEDRPFQCTVCSKGFKRHFDLLKHERLHDGAKPFRCQLCPKSFAQKSYLRDHEKVHAGKAFMCEICLKFFETNHSLNNHKIFHAIGSPFRCQICLKGFARKYRLEKHKRIFEGRSCAVDKPFVCKSCPESFTLLATLRRHEEVHTE